MRCCWEHAQTAAVLPLAGVYVKLHGAEAYDFLEKLTYLVLPSQNAFEGILTRSLDRAGHLHFR